MKPLPKWALIAPGLLIVLYAILIGMAILNRTGFYDAMLMPQPNHGFMHISWTGKTVAIWLVLLVATTLRRRDLIALALVGVVTQQIGDTIAGQLTHVDVFITTIGIGLSAATVLSLLLGGRGAGRN